MKKIFITTLVSFITTYFLMSFSEVNFNFKEWSQGTRQFLVIIVLASSLLTYLIKKLTD